MSTRHGTISRLGATVAALVVLAGCGVADATTGQQPADDTATQTTPADSADGASDALPSTAEVTSTTTDETTTDEQTSTPATSASEEPSIPGEWLELAAGEEHVCGIAADQSVWCWDAGRSRAVLLGALTSNDPKQVDAGPWESITAGSYYTCGIKTDQTAWCWGSGGFGALGNGNDAASLTPVQVGEATWMRLSAGQGHTCGIQADGSAWCWGWNQHGALGKGANTASDDSDYSATPVRVDGDAAWTDIAAGIHTTCGIQHDGSAWCWGYNFAGMIGDGTTEDRSTPTRVLGDTTWRQISTSYFHTCAIDSDNALWCWGHLDENPETAQGPELSPIRVAPGTKWSTITTGSGITCGVTADHEAMCWGWNGNGQLGSDVADSTLTPTLVVGGTDAETITTGYISGVACMTKTDNSGWCWGGYTVGNDDPRGAVTKPVRIGAAA